MRQLAFGANHLLQGFRLLNRPGLRIFVVIPFLINLAVFTGLVWLATGQFERLMDWMMPDFPSWLAWLEWLAWVLFGLLTLLLVFYSFTLVANLIGAPFNGLLAEKLALQLGVKPPERDSGVLAQMLVDLRQEVRKLLYFLLRAAALALLSVVLIFVPLLNALVPLLWFVFGAWMLAVEYSDYHLANQGLDFQAEKAAIKLHRWKALGFGAAAAGATLVPIVNFLVMPAAVAGATRMWVEILDSDPTSAIRMSTGKTDS